jgi:hypothetical protein
MSEVSEVPKITIKERVEKSIEGQKPSFWNLLSRKFIGNRNNEKVSLENLTNGVVTEQPPEQLHTQIEELAPGVEYFKELGQKPLVSLEHFLGIPEGKRTKGDIIANLIANNRFDQETETRFTELGLDGHLIGVGAASIFCMVEGFDECKSFTGIDVHPSPIAIGRVVSDLLKEHDTFESFFAVLSNDDQLKEKLNSIGLPEGYLDETVQSVKDAVEQYKNVQNRYPGMKADGFQVINFNLKNLFPLRSIERHYNEFVKLAKSGKMNFVQADFFNPTIWENLNKADPEMKTQKNLIFGSNAINHVFRAHLMQWEEWTRSGRAESATSEQEAIGGATAFNFRDWESSAFVFTLTTLDYKLQLTDKPPIYGYDEDQGEPTLV